MIELFLVACQVEFERLDTRHVTVEFVEKIHKGRSIEDLWIEQCLARKEAGL